MRKSQLTSLFALVVMTFVFSGCIGDKCNMSYSYMVYEPTYMPLAEFKNAARVEGPRALSNPGKIYVKGDYLFVNEIGAGVHVFDNRNPAAPVALAFLNAPGSYDLSAQCDKLYIDSSTDLLVFDISNPAVPQLLDRVEDALPHQTSYRGYEADPARGIVVNWKGALKTGNFDCSEPLPMPVQMNRIQNPLSQASMDFASSASRGVNPSSNGQAGSTSRFAILNERLYAVTGSAIHVFDVNSCGSPVRIGNTDLSGMLRGGEAETIFPLEDNLFLGTTMGMLIFDVNNADNPTFVASFDHATACDPVVVQDDYAYVTLRSGVDGCRNGWANQLDVVDVRNIQTPVQVASVNLSSPQGLAADGFTLYVCDGDAGLRVFNISNPNNPNLLETYANLNAVDVISGSNSLILTGKDGIVQYDHSNPRELKELSRIAIAVR